MKGLLTAALGLMLLLEGIFPFLFPRQWRETFIRIARFSDGQIRFLGLMALSCGILVLGLAELFS
ncbi:DUF2065 domain-containing protein [Noviherbaspirillum sp. UKPF54]|uniref:DUF2065 domain-containing protein n=1 Tax=Noviherbaspirillum sp. UKPF54 TaxID=2601898 RepID=UPI001AEF3A12|nr:DUF2065 domain-containing protein [Noviherbaspirillum sp. UKPF54]